MRKNARVSSGMTQRTSGRMSGFSCVLTNADFIRMKNNINYYRRILETWRKAIKDSDIREENQSCITDEEIKEKTRNITKDSALSLLKKIGVLDENGKMRKPEDIINADAPYRTYTAE